eukprot:Pgem_evm1s2760
MDLSYNSLTVINSDFDELFYLQDSNNVKGVSNLKKLHLQHNFINSIDEKSFTKLPFVHHLYMNNNEINEIPARLFSNFIVIDDNLLFNFTSNPISVIRNGTFSSLLSNSNSSGSSNNNNNDIKLFLENNTLSCCEGMAEIMMLLSNNIMLTCLYGASDENVWHSRHHYNLTSPIQDSCALSLENKNEPNSTMIIIIIVCCLIMVAIIIGVIIAVYVYKRKQDNLLLGKSAFSFVMEEESTTNEDFEKDIGTEYQNINNNNNNNNNDPYAVPHNMMEYATCFELPEKQIMMQYDSCFELLEKQNMVQYDAVDFENYCE